MIERIGAPSRNYVIRVLPERNALLSIVSLSYFAVGITAVRLCSRIRSTGVFPVKSRFIPPTLRRYTTLARPSTHVSLLKRILVRFLRCTQLLSLCLFRLHKL